MIRNKRKNSYSVFIRIGKKALLILLIIGIPALLFLSTFNIKKIEVIGAKRYTEDQIKELIIQSVPDSNSLYLYLKYRFFEKPKLPFVEKIDVDMVDNHTIAIYVYEKMIAGCVEFMGEYLYFDKDGIVVESTSQKLDAVPIIKGLKFNEIVLNEKLNVQKDELFDVIINLTQLIEKYELKVDTVRFNSSCEVTIDCGDVTVLLGKKDTYDEVLAELKNILLEVEGRKIEIDLRIYKKGITKTIGKQKK